MTADKPLCRSFTIRMPTLLMLNYWQPQWFGLFKFLSFTGFLEILSVLDVETFRGEWVTTSESQWRPAEQVLVRNHLQFFKYIFKSLTLTQMFKSELLKKYERHKECKNQCCWVTSVTSQLSVNFSLKPQIISKTVFEIVNIYDNEIFKRS